MIHGWLYRLRKEGFGRRQAGAAGAGDARRAWLDCGAPLDGRATSGRGVGQKKCDEVRRSTWSKPSSRSPTSHPPMPLDLFAVRAWGRTGGAIESAGFICEGRRELDDCVPQLVGRGWPHVDVINLSDINYEVIMGWNIATLGPDEARHEFELHYLPRLAEEAKPRAVAMFDDLQWRIAGGRRPAAPSNDTWTAWAPANAA